MFFTKEMQLHMSSPCSSSKAGADLLVLAYYRTYGVSMAISCCSNNYGAYHFPEKLIPLMIANALADRPLPVCEEGLNVRDWLYVEDHCWAIDPAKIHRELGWLSETKFEDGIKKIKWYLDNCGWWETIIFSEYQNYYEKMYAKR